MLPGSTSPDPAGLRFRFLSDLTINYYAALIAKGQKPSLDPDAINGVYLTLALCDALGQLRFFPGGFVAWLRFNLDHIDLAFSRDLPAVLKLGKQELTSGPVCFVAEVLAETPGQAYRAMRELSREPGITHMAAWRNLTRRKVQKLHGR